MITNTDVALIVDDTALGSPAQQILDRFLIGFTREGSFIKGPFGEVTVCAPREAGKLIEQRSADFRCNVVSSIKEATALGGSKPNANGVVVMSSKHAREVVENVQPGTAVFVYGLIGKTKKEAETTVR